MPDDALATIEYSPYDWTYTRDADGQFVADDPQAPAWSIEAWRAALAAEQVSADTINDLEQDLTSGAVLRASIVKSREAARAASRLAQQEDAIHADFRARFDALAAERAQEWATYANAFAANIRREAAQRYPGIPVQIDLNVIPSAAGESDDVSLDGLPEAHLIEIAVLHTRLPGSGIPPKDYPPGTSIHAAETAAGRLPYVRLPSTTRLSGTANSAGEQERG